MTKNTYTSRIGLHVDAPFGRVEMECFKCALAAENLELIDVFVTTVVARTWKTFRIFIGENGPIGFHDST